MSLPKIASPVLEGNQNAARGGALAYVVLAEEGREPVAAFVAIGDARAWAARRFGEGAYRIEVRTMALVSGGRFAVRA